MPLKHLKNIKASLPNFVIINNSSLRKQKQKQEWNKERLFLWQTDQKYVFFRICNLQSSFACNDWNRSAIRTRQRRHDPGWDRRPGGGQDVAPNPDPGGRPRKSRSLRPSWSFAICHCVQKWLRCKLLTIDLGLYYKLLINNLVFLFVGQWTTLLTKKGFQG